MQWLTRHLKFHLKISSWCSKSSDWYYWRIIKSFWFRSLINTQQNLSKLFKISISSSPTTPSKSMFKNPPKQMNPRSVPLLLRKFSRIGSRKLRLPNGVLRWPRKGLLPNFMIISTQVGLPNLLMNSKILYMAPNTKDGNMGSLPSHWINTLNG